jgi:hypothetical protein
MVEDVDLLMLKKYNYDVKTAFLHTHRLLVSCLVPEWPPVACKLFPSGHQPKKNANFGRFYSCCMRLAATRVQFACDWQSLWYNLHATGDHSGMIYVRVAASRMQNLHVLMASCMQSRQFFASRLQEQLFEFKNEDAIKKSENPRDTCASYPLTPCMARSNLVRQFL